MPGVLRELRPANGVRPVQQRVWPGSTRRQPYCQFFEAAIAGQQLSIHGDGEQTRDYTYISDAVEATLLAAIRPRAEGETFNVGTGIETSVNALAREIGRALDKDVVIRHIDRRDIDNIRRRVVNIEKARRMLRWTPQVTLEIGLRRTAEWMTSSGYPAEQPAVSTQA